MNDNITNRPYNKIAITIRVVSSSTTPGNIATAALYFSSDDSNMTTLLSNALGVEVKL